jgi:hypothetical protein
MGIAHRSGAHDGSRDLSSRQWMVYAIESDTSGSSIRESTSSRWEDVSLRTPRYPSADSNGRASCDESRDLVSARSLTPADPRTQTRYGRVAGETPGGRGRRIGGARGSKSTPVGGSRSRASVPRTRWSPGFRDLVNSWVDQRRADHTSPDESGVHDVRVTVVDDAPVFRVEAQWIAFDRGRRPPEFPRSRADPFHVKLPSR